MDFVIHWNETEVFIKLVAILFLFYIPVFGHKADGILAPSPGIKPATLALEGEVLTPGPLGKSPCLSFEWV